MDEVLPGLADGRFPRRTVLAGMAGGTVTAAAVALGVSRLRGSQQTIIKPEEFARPEDGDDAAPMIQRAIDHAAAAGGGTVRLTAGKTYPLRAIAPGSDISIGSFRASLAIPARAANLTFDLNGAILTQQSEAYTFGTAYRLFNDQVMQRTRVPLGYTPRRGETSIRVSNTEMYPPGCRIMLVSGNVYSGKVSPGHNPYTPVAEMFAVTGASGGSILIDRPVQKDHSIARGNNVGLINISQHFAQNLRIVGPGRIINHYGRAGSFLQVFGLVMERVSFEGGGGFSIRGRDLVVTDCDADIIRAPSNKFRPYAIAFDTGSNDIRVDRFTANGEPFCYIHLHEGLSNVRLSDIVIRNQWQPDPSWINVAAISIQGLSWNIDLDNVLVVNNPQGVGIGARESPVMNGGNYGLTMHNITLKGRFRNPAFQINDKDPAYVNGLDVSGVEPERGQKSIRLLGAHHQIVGLRG
jgi:hypothetical protein